MQLTLNLHHDLDITGDLVKREIGSMLRVAAALISVYVAL